MKSGKKFFNLDTLLFTILIFSLSCAVMVKLFFSERQSIQPVQVEIPVGLNKKPEIVGFIRNSINTINNWNETFNKLLLEQKKLIANKKSSNIYQQVKLISLSEKYLSEQNQFSKACDAIYQKADIYSRNLEGEEKKALEDFVRIVSAQEKQIVSMSNSILLVNSNLR